MGAKNGSHTGAAPTRVMSRRGKKRMDLVSYLTPISRPGAVRFDRRGNTTGDQANVVSAADATVQVCAAAWHNGHMKRAVVRMQGAVKSLRRWKVEDEGATADQNQKIQDLNIVVAGMLTGMKKMNELNEKLQAEIDAMKK